VKRRSHPTVALLIQLLIATIVLIFNLASAILSTSKFRIPSAISGQYFQGDCDTLKQYNTWLHLGINALSTLLLGSSNYASQILVAPTRAEIDEAHAKGKWFDIGVQSFRNWRRVGIRRRVVWVILMVSSILLHLMSEFPTSDHSSIRTDFCV
jgi:hypothetical protein